MYNNNLFIGLSMHGTIPMITLAMEPWGFGISGIKEISHKRLAFNHFDPLSRFNILVWKLFVLLSIHVKYIALSLQLIFFSLFSCLLIVSLIFQPASFFIQCFYFEMKQIIWKLKKQNKQSEKHLYCRQ